MSELVETLDQLLQGRIDIATAQRRAREISAGRGGVLPSISDVQIELIALRAAIGTARNADVRKWAGATLMVEVLAGTGILNEAIKFVMNMAVGTGGKCPTGARPYVKAMFDSILSRLPPNASAMVAPLLVARTSFLERPSAAPSQGRLTLWGALKDFGWIFFLFTSLGGAPSYLSLLEIIIRRELVPALQWIVDGYDAIVGAAGVYLEPLILPLIGWINSQFQWELHLQPHWRALFVLSMIWVAADVRSNLQARVRARAVGYGLLELTAALVGTALAGLAPVAGPWWVQGAIAVAPFTFLGLGHSLSMAVEAAVTKEDRPRTAFLRSIKAFVLISAIPFVVAAALSLVMSRGAGIVAFGLTIIAIAVGSLRMGLRNADTSATRHGLTSIGGLAVAGLILVANLALRVIGQG